MKTNNPRALFDKERRKGLSKNYGITPEDFERMHKEQKGRCRICKRTAEEAGGRWPRLHVDHCHTTGKVRGLLCSKCNTGLGMFQDSPERLENAVMYLLKHQEASP